MNNVMYGSGSISVMDDSGEYKEISNCVSSTDAVPVNPLIVLGVNILGEQPTDEQGINDLKDCCNYFKTKLLNVKLTPRIFIKRSSKRGRFGLRRRVAFKYSVHSRLIKALNEIVMLPTYWKVTLNDIKILDSLSDIELADISNKLNCWGWPDELPDPEKAQYIKNGRRDQLLNYIKEKIGDKFINRRWNKDRMTDEEHEDFWRASCSAGFYE